MSGGEGGERGAEEGEEGNLEGGRWGCEMSWGFGQDAVK